MNVRRTAGLAFVTVCISGCAGPTAPDPVSPTSLLSTPTSVTVEGKTLTLGAVLWRDFFPITPPGGPPMISVLRVQTGDGSAVPMTISAETMWLVRGTDIWSGVPREERAREPGASIYEVVARDGPKWDPGATVDVIIQLKTRGGAVRLRVANQTVQATY